MRILKNYDIGTIISIDTIEKDRNELYRVETGFGIYMLKILKYDNDSNDIDFSIFDSYFKEVDHLYAQLSYQESIYNCCKQENIRVFGEPLWNKLCVPIRTKLNDLIVKVNSYNYAFLMTWVNGKEIEPPNLSHKDLLLQGILLGIMHKNAHFKNKYKINYLKNLDKFNENILSGYKLGNYSETTYKKASIAIDKAKDNIKKLIKKQPNSLVMIHGDYYSYNLLKVKNIFIPIDFEYSSIGFLYQDLASILNEHDNSTLLKESFINGYKSIMAMEIYPLFLRTFQIYLTLLYLAANYKKKDTFSKWEFNYYG